MEKLRPIKVIIEPKGEPPYKGDNQQKIIKGFFHGFTQMKEKLGEVEFAGPAVIIERLDGYVLTIQMSESVSIKFTDIGLRSS